MEVLLACVFAYWLIKHGPQLVAEAIAELEFARRGEMSPLAEARLKRLLDAGIDPAFGGPMRQFVGNAWRDLWLGLDEERHSRRRSKPRPEGRSGRFADRLDEAVSRWADRWRHRRSAGSRAGEGPAPATPDAEKPGPGDVPAAEHIRPGDSEPVADDAYDLDEPAPKGNADGNAEPITRDIPAQDAFDDPGEPAEPEVLDDPIRVESTVGEPIQDTPAPANSAPATPERTEPMTAVTHVTGVVSGAAEARAIQRQVDAATAAFEAAMRAIRNRIHNLGNQTLGEVQQAAHSRVIAALQCAAEAAAAAEADAKRCSAEVAPQLGIVARHFDRLNS